MEKFSLFNLINALSERLQTPSETNADVTDATNAEPAEANATTSPSSTPQSASSKRAQSASAFLDRHREISSRVARNNR